MQIVTPEWDLRVCRRNPVPDAQSHTKKLHGRGQDTECITHRALCRTGGSILNQGNPRRGPGTIRRTGWHLPAFLKEFKEEAAKLIIGAISDV